MSRKPQAPRRDITNDAWGWVFALPIIALLSPFVWLFQLLTFEDWRIRRRGKAWRKHYEPYYIAKLHLLSKRDAIADARFVTSAPHEQKVEFRARLDELLANVPEDSEHWLGSRLSSEVYRQFDRARAEYRTTFAVHVYAARS